MAGTFFFFKEDVFEANAQTHTQSVYYGNKWVAIISFYISVWGVCCNEKAKNKDCERM